MKAKDVETLTDFRNTNDEFVLNLLLELRQSFPRNTVLAIHEYGTVKEYTAKELVDDVIALGSVFVSLSLTGKTVAIAGKCSYYWLVAYLAAVCTDAAALPVDPDLSSAVLSQQLDLADTELVICDGDCYKKINEKAYRSVIMLDNCISRSVQSNVEMFVKTGKDIIANGYNEFEFLDRNESAVTHIAFDSGAYGRDKAVTLSNRGLYAQIVNAADAVTGTDIYVAEHLYNSRSLICAVAAIAMGNKVSISVDNINIYDAAEIFEPQMLIVTPRLLSDYYVEIWRVAQEKGISRRLERLVRVSMALNKIGLNIRNRIAGLMKKRKTAIVREMLCFGNNIDEETSFGIHMLGINLRCAYAVPECGIVAYMRKSNGKNKTLGEPTEDVYIKVNEFKRLFVKADAVMSGYLGEGMYPDHWIPTGDSGDYSSGQIILANDPQKLYITNTAKRVFPERLTETVKKQIPYASSVSVEINKGEVELRIAFDNDFIRITGKQEIRRIVHASVDGINKSLSEHERIVNIVIDNIA